MANEGFQYYKFGGSNMHSVSLDAAKAFDKLWRVGLFYKLKLEFNALKSSSFSLVRTHLSDFSIGSTIIPSTSGFIYLGLPIRNDTYVQDFFSEKMSV